MFDAAAVGLGFIDRDRLLTECNDKLAGILQTDRERLLGFDMRKAVDQAFMPEIERALAGEHAVYQGPYHSHIAGADLVLVIHATPVIGPDGAVCGCAVVAEDATERVRMEEELRRQLELIRAQAGTIRALGTPILRVWEGVVCLPIIGAVDRQRIAEMTESMLGAIVTEHARFAIVDLTGVDTVDTETAHLLMQLVRTARLVGTDGVLCGLRPAVAQILVELGAEMQGIRTVRTMQDALRHCIAIEARAVATSTTRGS